MTTSFYDDHADLKERAPVDDLAAFAGAVALAEHRREHAAVQSRIPAGFRNVVSQPQSTRFDVDGTEVDVQWYGGRAGFTLADQDPERPVTVVAASPDLVVLDIAGTVRRYRTRVVDDAVLVDGPRGGATLRVVPRFVDPASQVAAGSLLAPMPGSVIAVHAAGRATWSPKAQPILVMEAMKMQHTIAAPYAGTVTELAATTGQQVEAGTVLAVVTPDAERRELHDDQLHRARGADRPARGGQEARRQVRPRVTSRSRPARAARSPSVAGDGHRTASSASTSPRSTAAVAAAWPTSPRCSRRRRLRALRC